MEGSKHGILDLYRKHSCRWEVENLPFLGRFSYDRLQSKAGQELFELHSSLRGLYRVIALNVEHL
jgi:hypothetical protein